MSFWSCKIHPNKMGLSHAEHQHTPTVLHCTTAWRKPGFKRGFVDDQLIAHTFLLNVFQIILLKRNKPISKA